MKKILGIFCITLLLGSCSSFLEEYSQDLSKVESYTDLDEVLLGEAYLPVGRIWSANSMLKVENKYFQTAHYMSDELTVFSWDDRGDINGVQDEMFGWHTWQQDVGLNAEGSSRNAEDEDWNKAYHCINICNMVIDAIDEQHAANEEQKLEKSRIKGEAPFFKSLILLHAGKYVRETLFPGKSISTKYSHKTKPRRGRQRIHDKHRGRNIQSNFKRSG